MQKIIQFIIPIFNEQGNIRLLYEKLLEEKEKLSPYEVRFLFINDGSRDRSLELLAQLAEKDTSIQVITLARNFGHEMAITAGMDYFSGDSAIVMDADLQDPPEVAAELIKKWEEGYDVVYAQRKTRKDSILKRLTAHLFYRLLERLSDIKIPTDTGNFRLMDKKVVQALTGFREKNRYMRGLVSFVGFRQTAVLFDRDERHSGDTHYPVSRMITLSLDAITSFSTIPLQLILQIGVLGVVASLVGILYVFAIRLFYPEIIVSGWPSIMLVVLFLGSVQMIMLGIIGVYIGRIYSEVQQRPLYVVSSVVDYGKKKF